MQMLNKPLKINIFSLAQVLFVHFTLLKSAPKFGLPLVNTPDVLVRVGVVSHYKT